MVPQTLPTHGTLMSCDRYKLVNTFYAELIKFILSVQHFSLKTALY